MRVQDIMNPAVATVACGQAAEEAWRRMMERRCHHLVVVEEGKALGVLSDRDLGGARGARLREGKTVADLMSPQLVTVEPGATLRQAANLLRGHSIGCLPVLDGPRLVGIVTISDVLVLVGRGAEKPVPKTRRWTLKHRGRRHSQRALKGGRGP